MTGDKKSIEFFFGATTYLSLLVSIIVRPEMEPSDKILTVGILQGLAWLAKLFFRINKDKILNAGETLAQLNESMGVTITAPKQISKDKLVSAPSEQ